MIQKEKTKVWFVKRKYNYPEKFIKAIEEGNLKYIKYLIKKGKVYSINAEVNRDSCGNVFNTVLKQ